MLCEVLKPFQALDRPLAVGEHVDTTAWRPENLRSLLERRYVRPVEGTDLPPPTKAPLRGKET